MSETGLPLTRCMLCGAAVDRDAGERLVCLRCSHVLGTVGGAEAVREKLSQLADFGLGADGGPLLDLARERAP